MITLFTESFQKQSGKRLISIKTVDGDRFVIALTAELLAEGYTAIKNGARFISFLTADGGIKHFNVQNIVSITEREAIE